MTRFLDFLRSGWSFYFRFPNTHTESFSPPSIYLGPVFQALVFLFFCEFYYLTCSLLQLEEQLKYHLVAGALGLSCLTGFFHEDGLADTADGFGVPSFNKSPDRIEKIRVAMKDSRLGSYGVTALILLWLVRFEFLRAGSHEAVFFSYLIFCSRAAGLVSAGLLLPGLEASTNSDQKCANGGFQCLAQSSGSDTSEKVVGDAKEELVCSTVDQSSKIGGLPSHSLVLVSKKIRVSFSFSYLLFSMLMGQYFGFGLVKLLMVFCCYLICLAYLVGIRARNKVICGDSIGSSICLMELIFLFLFL